MTKETNSMNKRPTIEELRADEHLLRMVAGKVLPDLTTKHCYTGWTASDASCCCFCGKKPWQSTMCCGSLPEVAEALVKKVATSGPESLKLWDAILDAYLDAYLNQCPDDFPWPELFDDLQWFILWATPLDRILCCLVALGVAEIGDQKHE
jgi:hypothetical protein